jgi:hypothetical protein
MINEHDLADWEFVEMRELEKVDKEIGFMIPHNDELFKPIYTYSENVYAKVISEGVRKGMEFPFPKFLVVKCFTQTKQ